MVPEGELSGNLLGFLLDCNYAVMQFLLHGSLFFLFLNIENNHLTWSDLVTFENCTVHNLGQVGWKAIVGGLGTAVFGMRPRDVDSANFIVEGSILRPFVRTSSWVIGLICLVGALASYLNLGHRMLARDHEREGYPLRRG